MSTKTKTLAKSLHTVTVLVNVARLVLRDNGGSAEEAVADALQVLGYEGALDPYGLASAAAATLIKETSK